MNNKALITYFEQLVTPERLQKIKAFLLLRTRHVSVALEDLYQSHNAAAIVRSCEAFGVQDLHCITDKNKFQVKNTIASGAAKWLTLQEHKTTDGCIALLKERGYTVVATSPDAATTLESISLDQKIVLFFGTEQDGLSQSAIEQADQLIKIPMFGFTQSLNVSVSVGICLQQVTTRLRNSTINWQLSAAEQDDLYLVWLKQSVPHADLLEKRFLELK